MKESMRTPRITYFIVICLILSFFSINVYSWLKIDTRPLRYDQSCLLERSLTIHNSLKNGCLDFIQCILSTGNYADSFKPTRIIHPLTSALLLSLFGKSEDTAVMANIILVALLLWFTYLICARYLNRKIGLLSIFILACSPLLFHLAVQNRDEIAAAAIVVISIYLLLRSNYFSNRAFSILFGLTFGLGFLTKELYPVFIIGPLCYVSLKACVGRKWLSKGLPAHYIFTNWIVAISLGLAIAGIWYIPHFNYVGFRFSHNCFAEQLRVFYRWPKPLSLAALIFYARDIINFRMPFFYFAIFCISLPFLYIRKSMLKQEYKHILASWALIPYFILTLATNKCPYYYLPSYSAVAVVICAALFSIDNRLLKRGLVTAAATLSITQFFFVRLGPDILPVNEDWKAKDILSFINNDTLRQEEEQQQGQKALDNIYVVGVLFNGEYLSAEVLQAQSLMFGFDNLSMGWLPTVFMIPLDYGEGEEEEDIVRSVEDIYAFPDCTIHYVVTKTGAQGHVAGAYLDARFNRKIAGQLEDSDLFEKLLEQFKLPDSSEVTIFRRKAF